MPATTLFERRMEKALEANATAMFTLPLGDSHQYARHIGIRQGLKMAETFFKEDYAADKDDKL